MNKPQTLARINPVEAERFLTHLANLLPNANSIASFWKRFGYIIPTRKPIGIERIGLKSKMKREDIQLERFEEEWNNVQLDNLQHQLRTLWCVPDIRTKQYLIFLMWRQELVANNPMYANLHGFPVPLPPPTPFEQVMQYLLSVSDRTLICANPSCYAQYFIAKRRSQKYCSDACAQPAQQQYKLQWWRMHGSEWRAKRKPKKSQRKGVK
jgi:hypothetical protein